VRANHSRNEGLCQGGTCPPLGQVKRPKWERSRVPLSQIGTTQGRDRWEKGKTVLALEEKKVHLVKKVLWKQGRADSDESPKFFEQHRGKR